jgi:hypothetical protein
MKMLLKVFEFYQATSLQDEGIKYSADIHERYNLRKYYS